MYIDSNNFSLKSHLVELFKRKETNTHLGFYVTHNNGNLDSSISFAVTIFFPSLDQKDKETTNHTVRQHREINDLDEFHESGDEPVLAEDGAAYSVGLDQFLVLHQLSWRLRVPVQRS